MRIRKGIVLSMLFFAVNLSAQNYSIFRTYEDLSGISISINPSTIVYSDDYNNTQYSSYSINCDSSEFFLYLDNKITTYDGATIQKILLLSGTQIDLSKDYYKIRNLDFLFIDSLDDRASHILLVRDTPQQLENRYTYTNCSSSLAEKTHIYDISDLSNYQPATPWVEGVEGYGIGEGFDIENRGFSNNYILIMNGYISFDKPYLYLENSRIKKVKITGLHSGKNAILDVLDTPNPQTIDISFLDEEEGFRFEIIDVYTGTKYDDTCINYLVPYKAQVIPYMDYD